MNEERLQHLLSIAKNLDMDRLDMGTWGSCGSVACLAGHAARDPDFIAQGLYMGVRNGGSVPAFKGEGGFQALDAFFDLHGLETTHLFSPIAYMAQPSREELLEHINDILAGNFEEKFGSVPEYLEVKEDRERESA